MHYTAGGTDLKLYRGPYTGSSWKATDSKKPSEYVDSWQDGRTIPFDGTIDKDGERHTQIGVQIEDDDVVALLNALVKRDRKVTNQLRAELSQSQREEERLRNAINKLYSLVDSYANSAPSQEALLDAVRTIAEHYSTPSAKGVPKISWIKWKSL